MTSLVLASVTASVGELQESPMKILQKGEGQPVAIMDGKQTAFYLVPPTIYEQLIETADDQALNAIADARMADGQGSMKVSHTDL